jgi:subfamily B ATP-binding cassette protein MsbA
MRSTCAPRRIELPPTVKRFRPYLHYLRAVRLPLAGAGLCAIIYGAANGAGLPLMIKWVFPQIFPSTDTAGAVVHPLPLTNFELVLIALWLPAVFVVRGVAGYLNSYLIQLCGVRVLEALRLDFFRKVQVLPLSFLQRQPAGDLISRGLADTNQLQFTLTNVANEIMKQPASLIGSVGVLVWMAFTQSGVIMVLVCLALIPACVLPIRFVGRKLVKRAAQIQSGLGDVSARLSENLGAAREVRAFGLEEREAARFAAATRGLVTWQMKAVKYAQALTPAIEIISACGISVTLVYAYHARISLEAFLALITALYTSYDPVKKLGGVVSELKRGTAALDRLEAILNEPITIADPAAPVAVTRLRGDIAFTNVSFAYASGAPVLRDISVNIPAGTVCALVGPTGAGKSSFANLVPRFHDVTAGTVTVDGHDVRSLRLADLRRNLALVSQETVLFRDTVLNNILLGRPGATRAEAEQAARDAHAHAFITALPQGYDTLVGERGATLSGGQRQRVALARAFLRDAPILILDEATSALDSESEAAVQAALKKLMAGRTVLIIAHRFSTIRDASLILVFDQGCLAAAGPHAQLLVSNPLYKSLHDLQAATGTPAA